MRTQDSTIVDETSVPYRRPMDPAHTLNANDVRRFVYEWFTHFEHLADVEYYVDHIDAAHMRISFPGMAPLTTHAAFAAWYTNLLAQTLWNFHDLAQIQAT